MANNVAITTIGVGDLKGAFKPNLPFGSPKLGMCMAHSKDELRQKSESRVIDVSRITRSEKPDQGRINFLGHEIEADEYKLICSNLREFFSLLKAWRINADHD